jgi:hypothetical protein
MYPYNNSKIAEWIFMKLFIADATFEVLAMVTVKFTVFCDVMLLSTFWKNAGKYIYQTTWQYVPEDSNHHRYWIVY